MPDEHNPNIPRCRRVWKMPTELETRAVYEEKQPPKIAGYAAVFDQTVEIWEGYFERIAPGAFKATIGTDDVRALFNHDPSLVLGRNKSGTLALSEDEHGLRFEIVPPDTQWAKDLMTLLKRKDVTQSSFGFNIVRAEDDRSKKGRITRTLLEVKLFDVSPVTYPAYPGTDAHVRMTRSEAGIEYVVDGEVLTVPLEDAPAPVVQSDEQLFREWEEIKQRASSPRQRT